MLVTLRTYVCKYGLRTVREIITRWAPPQDNNDTERYIKYVTEVLYDPISDYVPTFLPFDFKTNPVWGHESLFKLCRAICWMESRYELPFSVWQRAFELM